LVELLWRKLYSQPQTSLVQSAQLERPAVKPRESQHYWLSELLLLPGMIIGILLVGCLLPPEQPAAGIFVDHTSVAKYASIPQAYIDKVKKMWFDLPGESHSYGYRVGLLLLQAGDSKYAVNVTESGTPEGYTDQHLRASRATWGDVDNSWGWIYEYGEEDWYTSTAAIARTKAHLTYCNTHDLEIAAFGFGWCWDMSSDNDPGGGLDPDFLVHWAGASKGGPQGDLRWGLDAGDTTLTGNSVCMDTYLNATQQYVDYCASNGYPTKVFFTTGPVDTSWYNTGENGYQRHLKTEYIRSYVNAHGGILFDYADILCWGNDGTQTTVPWTDSGGTEHVFPYIHDDNMHNLDGSWSNESGHIGERGALRLGKALWYLLARLAGWSG
jgi:hypothetical protein